MPFFLFCLCSYQGPTRQTFQTEKNENQLHMSGLVEWNQLTYLEAFAINHIVLIEIGLRSLTSLLLARQSKLIKHHSLMSDWNKQPTTDSYTTLWSAVKANKMPPNHANDLFLPIFLLVFRGFNILRCPLLIIEPNDKQMLI